MPGTVSAAGPGVTSAMTGRLKDVDAAGAVVETADPSAGHMGQSEPGVLDLPIPGAAGELPERLDDLCGTAGADRVALGQQPATRVDDGAPAVGGRAVSQQA